MEWIGFAQGSGFPVIKVNLKLFAGVCLQLILPTTMGSVKLKHHKNITHGTCACGTDTQLSRFYLVRIGVGVDKSQMCFSQYKASGPSRGETKVEGFCF